MEAAPRQESTDADECDKAEMDDHYQASRESVNHDTGRTPHRAVGDSQTMVTIFNSLAGHGFGKLIVGFVRKAAA